jgi:polyribonucleotide nucleotidyltransferase
MIHRHELELAGRTLLIETGRVAKQANGAVWLQYGDTVVLVTACRTKTPEVRDFLPLIVDYREKFYAAGRVPGNIFKREGRPSEKETLNARLTDHQIRPMFPKHLPYEIQVYITVLSADGENDADILGMIGASAALSISDIPFAGPMGAVRVGRIDGELVLNPTHSQLEESDLDIIVSHIDLQATPALLRNDSHNGNHWLGLTLMGRHGVASAIAARVTVWYAGKKQVHINQWSTSYLTNHDQRMHIGLGRHKTVDSIVVKWSDGTSGTWYDPPVDRYLIIQEGDNRIRQSVPR